MKYDEKSNDIQLFTLFECIIYCLNVYTSEMCEINFWRPTELCCIVGSAPFSNSSRTIASRSRCAAQCSGVQPSLYWVVGSAPFSNNNQTSASCPLCAAQRNGVQPSLYWVVGSAPFFNSNQTSFLCP